MQITRFTTVERWQSSAKAVIDIQAFLFAPRKIEESLLGRTFVPNGFDSAVSKVQYITTKFRSYLTFFAWQRGQTYTCKHIILNLILRANVARFRSGPASRSAALLIW